VSNPFGRQGETGDPDGVHATARIRGGRQLPIHALLGQRPRVMRRGDRRGHRGFALGTTAAVGSSRLGTGRTWPRWPAGDRSGTPGGTDARRAAVVGGCRPVRPHLRAARHTEGNQTSAVRYPRLSAQSAPRRLRRRRPGHADLHRAKGAGNTLAAYSGAGTREMTHRMGRWTMRAALIYQQATSERNRKIILAVGTTKAQARDMLPDLGLRTPSGRRESNSRNQFGRLRLYH
jgi:hypothetical protein